MGDWRAVLLSRLEASVVPGPRGAGFKRLKVCVQFDELLGNAIVPKARGGRVARARCGLLDDLPVA